MPATLPTTVGELIDQGVRVTRYCDACRDYAVVDLPRIAREKGWTWSMLDRLPLCTNGDCLGMIRFKAERGVRAEWLMTAAGEARFDAHTDWMFQTRQVAHRRGVAKLRRGQK